MGSKVLEDIMRQQQQQRSQKIQQEEQRKVQAQRSSPENIAAFLAATNKSPAAVMERIAPTPPKPVVNLAGFEKPKGLDLLKAGPEYMLARQHGLNTMQQGDGASALRGQAEYWGNLAKVQEKNVNEPAKDLNALKLASMFSNGADAPFGSAFLQTDTYSEAKRETSEKLAENSEKYRGYLAKQNEALGQSYASLMNSPDFGLLSGGVIDGEQSDPTLKRINGEQNTSMTLNNPTLAMSAGFDKLRTGGLDYLTDDERAVYNYLYNTQGKDAANDFVGFIENELNSRYGKKLAGDVRGSVLGQYAVGFVGGLDRSGAGIAQLFDKDVKAQSPLQHAMGQIRQDLANTGPQVLGSSLGQMGFDAANTVGNMAPAILISALTGGAAGPALGAAYTGLSTGGNAYASAVNEGFTPAQARTYGALVGAAEGGLQYLIGGIGKLGGVADDVLLAKVKGIDNALARIALTGAIKVGSEVTEENLQDILEPAFRTLITGEEYDAPTFEQLAYTTLLTALTTGVLESGEIAAAGRNTNTAPNVGPVANTPTKGKIDAVQTFVDALGGNTPTPANGVVAQANAVADAWAGFATNQSNSGIKAQPRGGVNQQRGIELSPPVTTDSMPQTPQNGNSNLQQNAMPEGMGAASQGFTGDYGRLQQQSSSFINPGENPVEHRVVDVPAQDFQGRNISATARTALEAEATADVAVPTVEQAIADGDFSYDSITNAQTLEKAKAKINERGFELAFADWKQDIKKSTNADNVAMGWALYNGAVNGGNTALALDILTGIAGMQRNAAQALQAQRILKKMSPEGQLYAAQRSVANLQEELEAKHGDKAPNLQIDEALVDEFLHAETEEERQDALYNIYRDIGRQMPSTFADKWNAWRYMAMLTNVRTHVRNILGNFGFVPARAVKNTMATVLEAGTDNIGRLFGGEGIERTKAFLNYTSKADRALVKSALKDFATIQEQALSSGKFDGGMNTNSAIQEGRRIFKSGVVEGVRKANNFLLDAEDAISSRFAYGKALAGWLKANKVTLSTANSAQLDTARAYAIKEAQKATYRDLNAFSELVTQIGFKNADTGAKKLANGLIEGVLPFKKTPANILVRGVEYSPVGLAKAITVDAVKVHNGTMTAAEMLDNLSAGLTGTGVMALGGLLAALGYVTGSGDDDEKQNAQDKLTGHQGYSLEIGGKSITLDWLAPVSIPFFIGVELWNKLQDGSASFWDAISSLGAAAEPMLEMSMLQSLNDLLDNIKYSEGSSLVGILANAATSYFSQALPTIGGQLARTIDGTRRTSYTDPNSEIPPDVQYLIQTLMGKVPGLASQKEPFVDAWGREEVEENPLLRAFNNFINPAYTSDINETEVDKELQRLYDSGAGDAFPTKSAKSFTYDGEKIAMDAEEYAEYSKVKGQTSYDMVSALIASKQYAAMSDEQKAKVINDIYEISTQIARREVLDGRDISYELEGNAAKIAEAEGVDITPAEWFAAKLEYNAIGEQGGSETQHAGRFANWLSSQGYSQRQENFLREQMKYWNMVPAEATRYDALSAAGISNDNALKVTESIAALTPPAGRTSVQAWQQYETIIGAKGLSGAQRTAAMAVYEPVSAGQKSKVLTAAEYGVDMADFADFAQRLSEYKLEDSSLSKDELAGLLRATSYDNTTKAILWAMNTTAKYGNPFGNAYSGKLEWVYAE